MRFFPCLFLVLASVQAHATAVTMDIPKSSPCTPITSDFTGTNTTSNGTGSLASAATDYTIKLANADVQMVIFTNTSASASITLNPTGAAFASSAYAGIPVPAQGSIILDTHVPNTAWHVASTAGAGAATYWMGVCQ